jgi:uncharacterized membrane protein
VTNSGSYGPRSPAHLAAAAVRSVEPHLGHHGTFGNDRFGVLAERFARFFGTPRFIIGQTMLVAAWIALNAAAFSFRWDPYPFILLNLAFSTQAAYAAPLILLAQTRQAERDKLRDLSAAEHRDAESRREHAFEERLSELLSQARTMSQQHQLMLAQNTQLTETIARLTSELHDAVISAPDPG